MHQKLITKEIEEKFRQHGIGSTDVLPADEVVVIAKFFNPYGAGSWFVTEAERLPSPTGDWLFFGYVTGLGCNELGYFRLSDLTSYQKFGKPAIERDMHFGEHRLSEVMEGIAQ